MKHIVSGIVCVFLLTLLLVACGGRSQAPTAFMSTDANSLLFLQWQPGTNGQIAGQWYSVMYETPYIQNSQVQTSSAAFTGTLTNGQIVIQSSGITIYTGQEQENDLLLNGTNSQGQAVQTRWYGTDRTTYNQLVSVFEAHMNTRVKLAMLSATLNLLPVDSDPATANAKVQGIKGSMEFLQSTWDENVANKSTQADKCSGLQYFLVFYPYQGGFDAPDASQSTLATQIAQVQTQWLTAQKSKGPVLPVGMTTPWKLSQTDVTNGLKPAQKALSNLQTADKNAQTQLDQLQAHYHTLSTQVETLKRTCNL